MYGGAAQPSPAQLAEARLSAQKTLYNAALGVVLLHSGEAVWIRRKAECASTHHSNIPARSALRHRLPGQAVLSIERYGRECQQSSRGEWHACMQRQPTWRAQTARLCNCRDSSGNTVKAHAGNILPPISAGLWGSLANQTEVASDSVRVRMLTTTPCPARLCMSTPSLCLVVGSG